MIRTIGTSPSGLEVTIERNKLEPTGFNIAVKSGTWLRVAVAYVDSDLADDLEQALEALALRDDAPVPVEQDEEPPASVVAHQEEEPPPSRTPEPDDSSPMLLVLSGDMTLHEGDVQRINEGMLRVKTAGYKLTIFGTLTPEGQSRIQP